MSRCEQSTAPVGGRRRVSRDPSLPGGAPEFHLAAILFGRRNPARRVQTQTGGVASADDALKKGTAQVLTEALREMPSVGT